MQDIDRVKHSSSTYVCSDLRLCKIQYGRKRIVQN